SLSLHFPQLHALMEKMQVNLGMLSQDVNSQINQSACEFLVNLFPDAMLAGCYPISDHLLHLIKWHHLLHTSQLSLPVMDYCTGQLQLRRLKHSLNEMYG